MPPRTRRIGHSGPPGFRSQRGTSRSRPGAGARALVALTAAGLIAGAALWLVRSGSAARPAETTVAIQTVELAVETEALVVRPERVYTAPQAGTVRRLVAEGQRVRAGSPVVEIGTPAGAVQVLADAAGVVLYQTDGLEPHLLSGRHRDWTPAWFRALPNADVAPMREGPVNAGAPLFKIVDNFSFGLVVAAEGGVPPVDVGRLIHLRLGRDGGQYPARILHLAADGGATLLYVTADQLPESLLAARRARVTLLFESWTGKVVPRTALDVRGGRQGVWSMETGTPVFVPVRVIGGSAAELVIESTIAQGARLMRFAPTHLERLNPD